MKNSKAKQMNKKQTNILLYSIDYRLNVVRVIECYDLFVQMESLTGQLRELQRLYTETCNKLTTATNEIETIPKLRQDNLSFKMQNKNLEEKIQVLYVSENSIFFHILWANIVIELLIAVVMAIKERNLEKKTPQDSYRPQSTSLITTMSKLSACRKPF